MSVNLPLTGSGGTTATVATEQIGGAEYQLMKLIDGTGGSTLAVDVMSSAPSSGDPGLLVRLIQSSSANYQFMQSIPFSSGNVARSSVSTTVDRELIAANANRKALIIANRSTAQTVGVGFSTASVTTALANVDFYIAPSSYASFGLQGGFPLYLGPLRGINLTSTTVAGSVGVTEFT